MDGLASLCSAIAQHSENVESDRTAQIVLDTHPGEHIRVFSI
jgi:hypothetical protein